MKWNNHVSNFVESCGRYSLAIYVAHWTFTKIFEIKPNFTQNELLSFLFFVAIAIAISAVCIALKKFIALFPVADFILYGNYKALASHQKD